MVPVFSLVIVNCPLGGMVAGEPSESLVIAYFLIQLSIDLRE